MGKAMGDDLPLARGLSEEGPSPRPFYMAALTASAIGIAAVTLGMVTVQMWRQLPAETRPQDKATLAIFAGMFIGPGAMYVLMAVWVARRRRWAVIMTLLLAMLDVALLGALFVTSVGQPGSGKLCGIVAMFVLALMMLAMYLGRCLMAMKRMAVAGNATGGNGR